MRFLPTAFLLIAAGLSPAQEIQEAPEMSAAEQEVAYQASVERFVSELSYQERTAELPGGIATLDLPAGYRYLDDKGAKKIVVDLWGNPPESGEDILGMVVPAGENLAHQDSWAIVLSFEADGYVSDDDADDIDYGDLLEQLQEGNRASNEQREAAGYGKMELKSWAVAPHYDKSTKVLYWAKRFYVGTDEDALNYDVRVLGRRGVLSLNAVAGMNRVSDIEAATPDIVSMVSFNEGHRYADFNPDTDKEADYSLAGLVLGGAVAAKLAAKAGILAKLGGLLLVGKKFIVIGVIAVAAFAKKIFGRKSAA